MFQSQRAASTKINIMEAKNRLNKIKNQVEHLYFNDLPRANKINSGITILEGELSVLEEDLQNYLSGIESRVAVTQ
jgi:hypothetical protein